MSRLVVINLGLGNLQNGCPNISAQILPEAGSSHSMQFLGSLPPAPALDQLYRRFQILYREFYRQRSQGEIRKLTAVPEVLTQFSEVEFRDLCQQLKKQLDAWLKSEEFLNIERQLRSQLDSFEEIRLIIQTKDELLQRLPWHCWDFFKDYRNAVIALSRPEYRPRKPSQPKVKRKKVRILGILGDTKGIELETESQFLKSIPDAETEFLIQPQRLDFNSRLWENVGWDILFFAGHSQTEGETGRIYINDRDNNNSLTIEELEEALSAAIERGLTLAIFNSCDGLGLANALAKLNIPQVIVMREQVPNLVAQEFFRYFLEAYALQRLPLYLAVQEARRKLQGLEDKFPAASWLPTLCQNPALPPPSWLQLGGIPPCPYRGLFAFREEDASLFFGRDKFIENLVAASKKKPLVAVLGSSGSGKSSVVFAGLIPRLRASSPVQIISFRPAQNPFDALAAALAPLWHRGEREQTLSELAIKLRSSTDSLHQIVESIVQRTPTSRLVLVADQFEELYTLCSKEDYYPFVDRLLDAVHRAPAFTLILTLRADFFGQALSYQPLGKALQDYLPELLIPMNRSELEKAIALPAAKMNVRLEEGLTKRLIDEIGERSGRLPLLEFALTQLWSKQNNGLLTDRAYEEIGGVEEALANHAESVYAQLSDADRQRAQRMFIQLVCPGEGTEDTRRLATCEEVKEENWNLVTRLADARLVVTNRNESTGVETVEIVHEALIKSWGRLHQWMQLGGEFRRWQEQLRTAMRQWQNSGKDDGLLLRGKPLTDAEDWQLKRLDELSYSERVFIDKSLEQRDSQIEKEKRRVVILRSLLGLVSGALLAALGFGVVAFDQSQKAQQQRIKAEKVQEGQINALSRYSDALIASDREFDALIEAIRAAKQLKKQKVKPQTQTQVEAELREAVYVVRERNRLAGHSDQIYSLSFSPDGQTLASTSADKTVKLWSKQGQQLQTLKGHKAAIRSVSFSPDGQTLASASADRAVKLWSKDPRDGKFYLSTTLKGHKGAVMSVSFSPNGQTLASASADSTVKLWNKNGEELQTLTGHNNSLRSLSFSPDGQTIASASEDKTVKLWSKDPRDGKFSLSTTLKGHKDAVMSVSFSSDGQTLGTGSKDLTAKLWSINGQELKTFKEHDSWVRSVSFSPDGQTIASADSTGKAKLWNAQGEELQNLKGHNDKIHSLSFSPDGQTLATASEDKLIKLWSIDTQKLKTVKVHESWVRSVSFSPDGQTIASATSEKSVRLFSSDGKELDRIAGHKNRVSSVSFSPDGQTLASAGEDKTIALWNVSQKKLLLRQRLDGHKGWIYSVSFSPDGQTLASASADNTVKLWSIDGKELQTLTDHKDAVNSVSFSPDGQILASASADNTVKLWTINGRDRSWLLLKTLTGHSSRVNSVSFSPDGQIIASASADNTVKLWSIDGKELQKLTGHNAAVTSVTFSSDSKRIATASRDKTVKLWTVKGKELQTLTGHSEAVLSVSFRPDSQTIASGSRDDSMILWNLDLEQLAIMETLDLDDLMKRGCHWVRNYLKYYQNLEKDERALCEGIGIENH